MMNIDWDKEFPAVPETVHRTVLDTLERLGEQKGKKTKKGMSKKRILLLSAAAVALLGTSAAAAELFSWNPKVVEQFDAPVKELQDKLTVNGVAKEQTRSASDQGITVKAVQTLHDDRQLYILLEVSADRSVIDGNAGFDGWDLKLENPTTFGSASSGFTADTGTGTLTDHGFYEIRALKDTGEAWKDESITVSLTEYSYYTYENGTETPHRINGSWELQLPLGEVAEAISTTYDLHQELILSGEPVTLNRVILSPLSLRLTYRDDQVRAMLDRVYGDQEDVFPQEIYVTAFLTSDGKEIPCAWNSSSGETVDGEFFIELGLNTLIEAEKVDTLLLGNDRVPVKLK